MVALGSLLASCGGSDDAQGESLSLRGRTVTVENWRAAIRLSLAADSGICPLIEGKSPSELVDGLDRAYLDQFPIDLSSASPIKIVPGRNREDEEKASAIFLEECARIKASGTPAVDGATGETR
jgi:hypothetical protein